MIHHGSIFSSSVADYVRGDNSFCYSCMDIQRSLIAAGTNIGSVVLFRIQPLITRLKPRKVLELLPPNRERSLQVALTCIRLSPENRYLAIGTAKGLDKYFELRSEFLLYPFYNFI
jgi:hypothetical protein